MLWMQVEIAGEISCGSKLGELLALELQLVETSRPLGKAPTDLLQASSNALLHLLLLPHI